MQRITVFCGSSPGFQEVFLQHAFSLGEMLAKNKIGLVYGGAKVGLMGAVADGALLNGGEVIGVLPKFLQTKEIAHEALTELILVDSMHERKLKMDSLSNGVIAMPGGYGTLEEFFEMLTWAQLGLHSKPVGLLNVEGFYVKLLELIQQMVDLGFLRKVNQEMLLTSEDAQKLIDTMREYRAPVVPKWITKSSV